MFTGAWGFEYVGDLRYIDPPRNTSMPRFVQERDRTEDVARELHHRMKTKPVRRLTRNDHLMFHAMRAVYRRMEAFSPTDYAYSKERGWPAPDARYFTDHARVGFLKSVYPRFVAWLMGRAMDRQAAGRGDSEEQDENGDATD